MIWASNPLFRSPLHFNNVVFGLQTPILALFSSLLLLYVLTMPLGSVKLAVPNSAFLFRSLRLELGVEKAFFDQHASRRYSIMAEREQGTVKWFNAEKGY